MDRQAIIERAEAFIHKLQEALARCSSAIDVMGALLMEAMETLRYFQLHLNLSIFYIRNDLDQGSSSDTQRIIHRRFKPAAARCDSSGRSLSQLCRVHALKSVGFNLDRAKALECPYGVAARRSGRPLWGRAVFKDTAIIRRAIAREIALAIRTESEWRSQESLRQAAFRGKRNRSRTTFFEYSLNSAAIVCQPLPNFWKSSNR